jgi:hypothetical protein
MAPVHEPSEIEADMMALGREAPGTAKTLGREIPPGVLAIRRPGAGRLPVLARCGGSRQRSDASAIKENPTFGCHRRHRRT